MVSRLRSTTRALTNTLLAAILSFAPLELKAQAPDKPADVKPARRATLADLEKGPHTGPVDEALVGIQVTGTNPNGTPLVPRYGNGFVLRCDGFIAVPFDLFNLPRDSTPESPAKLTIHVILHPGTEKEQRISMPRRSRYFIDNMRRMGFVVFRLDGAVHVPALRTMLPDTLKPVDQVEVVWRDWDAGAKRFGPLMRRQAILAAPPEPAEGKATGRQGDKETGRQGDNPRSAIRFTEPLEGIPAGAVVLGPEGLAVGMIPGGGAAARRESFVSFSVLSQVTNCVGAVPTPDSQFHSQVAVPTTPEEEDGSRKSEVGRSAASSAAGSGVFDVIPSFDFRLPTSSSKMVKVAGGPVIVPKAMLAEQPDMEGEPIACMAPFDIDRLEVTNAEYFAFWSSLPDKQQSDILIRQAYFPLGWAPVGEPFPGGLASLPVPHCYDSCSPRPR